MVLRGRRAVWKGPFFKPFKLAVPGQTPLNTTTITTPASSKSKAKIVDPNQIRTHVRNCTILPTFIGQTFHVHNGKDYIAVKVTEEMVGHRLGEFAPTKKPAIYAGDQGKK
ncbi:hypothetical protein MP638_004460 [Amoeboaphelidium occidentale]|nr:hypothetical protein MP638_004460 [Amoeboaphelidium occidentale]